MLAGLFPHLYSLLFTRPYAPIPNSPIHYSGRPCRRAANRQAGPVYCRRRYGDRWHEYDFFARPHGFSGDYSRHPSDTFARIFESPRSAVLSRLQKRHQLLRPTEGISLEAPDPTQQISKVRCGDTARSPRAGAPAAVRIQIDRSRMELGY